MSLQSTNISRPAREVVLLVAKITTRIRQLTICKQSIRAPIQSSMDFLIIVEALQCRKHLKIRDSGLIDYVEDYYSITYLEQQSVHAQMSLHPPRRTKTNMKYSL
jgi:hypothetical protein